MIVKRDKYGNTVYRGIDEPNTYVNNIEPGSFYETSNSPWLSSERMKYGVTLHSLMMELGFTNNDAFYKSLGFLSGDEEARYVAAVRSVARRCPGNSLFKEANS